MEDIKPLESIKVGRRDYRVSVRLNKDIYTIFRRKLEEDKVPISKKLRDLIIHYIGDDIDGMGDNQSKDEK